ncbi:MAG: RdgB/HAM1 family non-canonical purine NTP pyrophosphatase [Chloroflexota bacterium]|nr:RdgB/HAM1 family non-canonical purine NTP pyrophosphatase [Chloroflexota bacterium]
MSAGRRLLLATGSAHKLAELRELLDLPGTELRSLTELGLTDDAPEEGRTFEENATSKALHYARLSGLPALADDSGLEVDALGGRPGVHTRRYAGPAASDEDNNQLLLRELDGAPPAQRTARYRCVLVLAEPQSAGAPNLTSAVGTFEGRIALAPRGSGGFGYDPIFEPASEPHGGRTVGQLSAAEKNAISHRAQAARQMSELLRRRGF